MSSVVDRFGQDRHARRGVADQRGEGRTVEGGGGGCADPGGGGSVEADQGVEVDQAAVLVLRDLGVLDRGVLAQAGLRHPQVPGDGSAQGDGRAPPQLGGVPLPDDRRRGVVAVRAQRSTRAGVAGLVDRGAPLRASVRAAGPVVPTSRAAGPPAAVAVHEPERGRGERGEQQRVVRDLLGDGLAPGDPGTDEREGVAGVGARARRADVGAAVPARPVQHPQRRIGRAERREHLAGPGVDGRRGPREPDRAGAVVHRGQRVGEGVHRPVREPAQQPSPGRPVQRGHVERGVLTEPLEPGRGGGRSTARWVAW